MTWNERGWFLKSKPKPVQVAAMERGAERQKYGYYMEQGLAKTTVDMANFLWDLHNEDVDAHIVIAPSYLKSGWKDEAELWGFPHPMITWPEDMTKEGEIPRELRRKPHILVMNYEATLYSGGQYLQSLLDSGVRYSITLDESSAIKNFNGSLSKTIRLLCQPAVIRRELSGTPMTHDVQDWYAQLRFLGELNGINPYQFRNHYAVMGGYMNKKVIGVKNEEELHTILDRCSFRALKRDWWSDAPAKIPMSLEFEMTDRQKAAYKTMMQDFYYMVKDDDAIFANQVITAKLKLQQISRGFIKDADNDRIVELVQPKNNPAIKVVKDALDRTPGKMLIFTRHIYSTNILEEQLRKDWDIVVMRGGMTTKEIREVKDQFNNNPNIKACLGLSPVMSKGHTLLGQPGEQRCSTTLFYENDYNAETRWQAEDRNHRFGQDCDVVYMDLFCCQEDKACIRALQNREKLVEAVVNAVRSFPKV